MLLSPRTRLWSAIESAASGRPSQNRPLPGEAVLIILVLLTSRLALAAGQKHQPMSDEQIRQQVEHKLVDQ